MPIVRLRDRRRSRPTRVGAAALLARRAIVPCCLTVLVAAAAPSFARSPRPVVAGPAAAAASSPAATRQAELSLARRFGRGLGVPQSYANAGAWITGKGRSNEPLEPWDYSIGYAYTILAELLAGVRYPERTADQPAETSFVVEVDARQPTKVAVRMTSPGTQALGGLDVALEQAFRTRLAQTLPWLPVPDPRLVVAARVAVPVSIRYRSPTDVAVFEAEQLLR